MSRGLWLLVRSDLRRRWVGVGLLALLIGSAGAFVLTAANGARRADSALGRLREHTAMWDVALEVDYLAGQAVLADVEADPQFDAVAAFAFIPMDPGEGVGVLSGLGGGWLDTAYRPRLIAGRLPRSDELAEVLVNEVMAEKLGLMVGSSMVLDSYFGDEFVQAVTVVGVHRGVIDLALPENGPEILATSAFGAYWGHRFYAVVAGSSDAQIARINVVARLDGGSSGATELFETIAARYAGARPSVQSTGDLLSSFEQGLSIQVEAFWLLTLVAGAASLLLVGSGIARFVGGTGHPDATMLALGFSGRWRALVRFVPAAVVVTAGTLVAVIGAVIASPLVPLGATRRVDPDPGIWIDPATIVLGAAALLIGVGVIALLAATRPPSRRRRWARPGGGGAMPVWGRLGRDLAFRGTGHGRTSLMAAAVGLGLVVTVVVYSASLDRLLTTPRLFGSDFEVALYPDDELGGEARRPEVDLDHPAIEAAAMSTVVQVAIGGRTSVASVLEPLRGSAGGTVRRGRAPVAGDEVGLGPGLLERTGLDIGDTVDVKGRRQGTMRIVGEVLLPELGEGAYGDGIWLSAAGGEFIDVEPLEFRLLLHLAHAVMPDDLPGLIGAEGDPPYIPDAVKNIDNAGGIPLALGVFGAVLGAAMLVLGLVGIVRSRRRDLAIVQALGMDRRVIRAAVGAAGIAIVVPGLAIGVVGGVVLGRFSWARVAGDVPTVVQPIVPLGSIVVVLLSALVVAALAVAWPAWRAGHINPARSLHQE